MDRDGILMDEFIHNIVWNTAGDSVRAYYFKEGYGPGFLNAGLSTTQRKINFNTASMRNTVGLCLKKRIEIFKKNPGEPIKDIIGFFLS